MSACVTIITAAGSSEEAQRIANVLGERLWTDGGAGVRPRRAIDGADRVGRLAFESRASSVEFPHASEDAIEISGSRRGGLAVELGHASLRIVEAGVHRFPAANHRRRASGSRICGALLFSYLKLVFVNISVAKEDDQVIECAMATALSRSHDLVEAILDFIEERFESSLMLVSVGYQQIVSGVICSGPFDRLLMTQELISGHPTLTPIRSAGADGEPTASQKRAPASSARAPPSVVVSGSRAGATIDNNLSSVDSIRSRAASSSRSVFIMAKSSVIQARKALPDTLRDRDRRHQT